MIEIQKELSRIQKELKAPKDQWNDFSNFNYRSCEDILEAVKPLLGDCVLILSDEVVEVGGRIYVKATAVLSLDKEEVRVFAYAREPETKKGMDESQITGAASSYARKYALNGLFCIDDTKDADSHDNRGKNEKKDVENEENKPASTMNSNLITEKQLKLINVLLSNLYKDPKERSAVSLAFKAKYKVTSSKELTKKQASEIIEELQPKGDII